MKKLVLSLLCVFSMLFANAQTITTLSVEAGLGLSTWMGNGANNSHAIFNQHVGIGVDIPLSGWFSFKTGLRWMSLGAMSELQDEDMKVNQNYFQMPILASLHIGTKQNFDVVVSAGPYIAYGAKGKTFRNVDDVKVSWDTFNDGQVRNVDIWKGLRRFDAGVEVGVSLDFPAWMIGLNGDFGLCRLQKNGPRNMGMFVSGGYKF